MEETRAANVDNIISEANSVSTDEESKLLSYDEPSKEVVIEEPIVEEQVPSDNLDIEAGLKKVESNNEQCNENGDQKVAKNKRKRSLFRKSKKDASNKNKVLSTQETENSICVSPNHDNEKQEMSSTAISLEKQNTSQENPEKGRFFRKKSTKSAKVIEEDATTQTENKEAKVADPTLIKTNEDDENTEKKKVRKRSLGRRFIKMRKSSKWTNTNTEANEEVPANDTKSIEANEDKPEEKPEENIDEKEQSDDSFHDVLAPKTTMACPIEEETTTNSIEEPSNENSPSKISIETFIVHSDEECQQDNKLNFVEECLKTMNDEKIDLNEHYNETCDSQFTAVTVIPDTNCTSENPIFEEIIQKSIITDAKMDEINLKSDESYDNEPAFETEYSPTNKLKEEKDVIVMRSNEEKIKTLNFAFQDSHIENTKDESFFLTKKAAKAYKNAQLSKTYCQACCTLM